MRIFYTIHRRSVIITTTVFATITVPLLMIFGFPSQNEPSSLSILDLKQDVSKQAAFSTNGERTSLPRCVRLKLPAIRHPRICIHDPRSDRAVSGFIVQQGVYEPEVVSLFMSVMRAHPEVDLVDAGANIGQYTLAAAALGRKVVAIEPFSQNSDLLRRSLKLNGFSSDSRRITLVANALGRTRETVYFRLFNGNKGATSMWEGYWYCRDHPEVLCPHAQSVLMDDLLPVVRAMDIKAAVLKMDIEGAEHLALTHATELFNTIRIGFIFMEIMRQSIFCHPNMPYSEDRHLVLRMFKFLQDQGFTTVYPVTESTVSRDGKLTVRVPLEVENCARWPINVLWIHENFQADFLFADHF